MFLLCAPRICFTFLISKCFVFSLEMTLSLSFTLHYRYRRHPRDGGCIRDERFDWWACGISCIWPTGDPPSCTLSPPPFPPFLNRNLSLSQPNPILIHLPHYVLCPPPPSIGGPRDHVGGIQLHPEPQRKDLPRCREDGHHMLIGHASSHRRTCHRRYTYTYPQASNTHTLVIHTTRRYCYSTHMHVARNTQTLAIQIYFLNTNTYSN